MRTKTVKETRTPIKPAGAELAKPKQKTPKANSLAVAALLDTWIAEGQPDADPEELLRELNSLRMDRKI